MRIIGLMSGTSADGIDAALVEITGQGRRTQVRLLRFLCVPYTPEMRAAVLRLCDPKTAVVADLCALHAALGERFAEAARRVAEAADLSLRDVDAIASHGQTIWHQPTPYPIGDTQARGTLQIGSPAVIAAQTGCTVVSDFRSADMALGGQGAPLIPYADWALLTSDVEARAVQNIGGIANVTYLPKNAEREAVLAFDTGPGNMILDALVRRFTGGAQAFDRDGARAAQGEVSSRLLNHLLEHPFYALPPPKSTGREMFGEAYADAVLVHARRLRLPAVNLLATVTALTAESIARAYRDFLAPRGGVQTVIVGGGGSHNKTLMRMLAERLAPARLTTHAEFGIPDDAKEALAFALLGYETLHHRPSNIPSATGASRPAVLGSITPGAPVEAAIIAKFDLGVFPLR